MIALRFATLTGALAALFSIGELYALTDESGMNPVGAGVTDFADDDSAESRCRLKFLVGENDFSFDTSFLQGSLRYQGKSLGLFPIVESVSEVRLTKEKGYGVLSHYRLLDADKRYGPAAWDWSSRGRLLSDGSVETQWTADTEHPFDMKAVYRLVAPGTIDVNTTVTARNNMNNFEVFIASYFSGFNESFVYVKGCRETGGKDGFIRARKSRGVWQMFPRSDAAAIISDGRWKRPPSPVDWNIGPEYAAPLAMRRHAKTNLAVLLMAPAEDCFAVATSHDEDPHCSLYLSMFGRNVEASETVSAQARLVVANEITDQQAIDIYDKYQKGLKDEK